MFVEPESVEDKENDDPEDTEGQASRLWVDRFSPRHYTELLSDDVRFLCDFVLTPPTFMLFSGSNSKYRKMMPVCVSVLLQFTNRCLLKWLKLWDTVVFGRERKSRPARFDRQAPSQSSSKPNQANQNAHRFKSKVEVTEELLEADLDQYKRPKFKVNSPHTHLSEKSV